MSPRHQVSRQFQVVVCIRWHNGVLPRAYANHKLTNVLQIFIWNYFSISLQCSSQAGKLVRTGFGKLNLKYYGKDKAMQLVTTSALAGFIFMVALSDNFLSLFLKNIHGYNQHAKPKNFRIYVFLIPRWKSYLCTNLKTSNMQTEVVNNLIGILSRHGQIINK